MDRKKEFMQQFLLMVMGNLLLASSVSFLILPNNILTGGVAGVSVALEPLFNFNPVWMVNGLTVGLYLIGALLLGKEFAIKSMISTILYPFFVTTLSAIVPWFGHDTFIINPLLATIYSGVLAGTGLGMVFRTGGSTGGMDIPALILHKYTHISQGNAVMIIDILTVGLGVYTYGLEPALVGVLSVYVSGYSIDWLLTIGSQPAKNVMVISDYWEEVRVKVMDEVGRGVTLLQANGGYKKVERPVVMCVITQQQYPHLEKTILEVDPKAFIIVNDVHSVHGEGFNMRTGI